MIKQSCIPLTEPEKWKEALNGIRHSFAHTFENCYAMHLSTGNETYLYSFEKGNVKIICPVAERYYENYTDIVTPYGFSGFAGNGDLNEFSDYWNEFVSEKKYVSGYISMNPYFQNNSYFNPADSFQSTYLYFLDLNLSLTELFGNLDSNRKKQIKDYKKYESEFVYDKKVLTDFFINNYYPFLKRINASEANYFSKETLEYICSLDNVFMTGAKNENKIEAVYIFAYTEYSGDCLFNVALPEGREYSSPLLWCGLKYFKKKKIPVMNLGGGNSDDDSVALSKQRFGAFKLPYVNLKQIYDKSIYEKLCSEKGLNADNKDGYFPAYRIG